MLRMYRLKRALSIAFIIVLVLVVLFTIYSYMKDSAAMDGYEFNPFHIKHDYYYKDCGDGHIKVYSCGCYNIKMPSPHKYTTIEGNIKICKYCGHGLNSPYYR